MDTSKSTNIELLKTVLENLRKPEKLDDHFWTVSLAGDSAASNSKMYGTHLIDLVTSSFRKMIPANPPRVGKRLDTRWGAFGLLAAQYFAPALRGGPNPSSFREAWESIDRSILLFVYGRSDGLSDEERTSYKLVENEPEPAPNSTLSDWHRKGLEQLAESVAYDISQYHKPDPHQISPRSIVTWKQAGRIIGLLFLILALFFSWKTWSFYRKLDAINQKINELETYLEPTPKLNQFPEIATQVHALHLEVDSLQLQAEPYVWLSPYFGWIPVHGGDLSQAKDLLSLAQNLTLAADEGITAISPAIDATLKNNQPLEVMDLILQLQNASPQLLNAQVALAQAQAARERIDVNILSPRLRNIVLNRVDPFFKSISGKISIEDALTLVRIAPTLLGGEKAGPQTYMILVQNEDELRPTGGYLTAVGSAVVKDGKLIGISFETSEAIDDFDNPYPIPPWQFEEFMNIQLLLFRDSNWFTDFPTTVSWAEYFYSYTRAHSVDGVIALDQHVVAKILEVVGPVQVEGVNQPITSGNVMEYMRAAKGSPPGGVPNKDWDRKKFIGQLARPILEKILSARGETWTKLAPVLSRLLDERHILLQFDNEEAVAFLARRNWDGAIRVPQDGDFLMVVNTNMGYNKSNAIMEMALQYKIDLSAPTQPTSVLEIHQENFSQVISPCIIGYNYIQEPVERTPGEIIDPFYSINECNWGYMRIYTPIGTELLNSTPTEIPAASTMRGVAIPARTDDLGDEDIPGAQVFGAMVLTPTQQTSDIRFEYLLPEGVLAKDQNSETWTYRLQVQKQAGTAAIPLTVNLLLPEGAELVNMPAGLEREQNDWIFRTDLQQDVFLEIVFHVTQ